MMEPKYLQYGCGMTAHESWLNYDASPTLFFERLPIIGQMYTKNGIRFPDNVHYGDIVKGLPVGGASCNAVYCSHVLEHLSLEDFGKALLNTSVILSTGGVFRMVLPDIETMVREYNQDSSGDAAVKFVRATGMGLEKRPRGLRGFFEAYLGNSRHLWMWDYESLALQLKDIGFINIRRAEYGDSSQLAFNDVELESRWRGCLGIECKKP
ncbi:MAG: hypothetical protein V7711_01375 [Pseudomonadales bacterium]